MSGEEKSKETLQDVQAELSKHGRSGPLEGTKGEVKPDSVVVADGEDRINFFVWLLVACSSISGLLFGESFPFHPLPQPTSPIAYMLGSRRSASPIGYDTGVISGALVTIRSDLGPTVLSSGQKVSSGTPPYACSTSETHMRRFFLVGIDHFRDDTRCSSRCARGRHVV